MIQRGTGLDVNVLHIHMRIYKKGDMLKDTKIDLVVRYQQQLIYRGVIFIDTIIMS